MSIASVSDMYGPNPIDVPPRRILDTCKVGQKIMVEVLRGEGKTQLEVVLDEAPTPSMPRPVSDSGPPPPAGRPPAPYGGAPPSPVDPDEEEWYEDEDEDEYYYEPSTRRVAPEASQLAPFPSA